MTAAALPAPPHDRGFFAFVKDVYAPGLHLAYAAAWFFALQGALAAVEGTGAVRLDLASVAAVLAMFVVLFFLRAVDEWKDEAYDRVHNPDRPLVRGAVTLPQLFRWLALAATVAIALSAWLSPALVAVVSADMAWGLFLVALERRSRAVRDGMLANLAVTYPVNVALSVYGYVFFLQRAQAAVSARGLLVLAAFAAAFLVYELLRKTQWPAAARPGERLYSRELGPNGAIFAALVCASFAAGALATLFFLAGACTLAAVALVPLAPAIVAGLRFLRAERARVKLAPLGTIYLLAFYAGLVVCALATLGASFGAR